MILERDLQLGFRVGEFEVRPRRGEIEGPGGLQHLSPKAAEVLVCLASTGGEVVERNDLIECVWGRKVINDEVLTRCISELRHALNDNRADPAYIQTVPKRGYRLLAPVEFPPGSLPPTEPAPEAQAAHPSLLGSSMRSRAIRVLALYLSAAWLVLELIAVLVPSFPAKAGGAAAILAVALAAYVATMWFQIRRQPALLEGRIHGEGGAAARVDRRFDSFLFGALVVAAGALFYRVISFDAMLRASPEQAALLPGSSYKASIAVLPFDNLGKDPADEYFGDGLAEELLHRLARVDDLKVAARTSSWYFKDSKADIPTVAARLQVDSVMEGSVRREGDRVRIAVQLLDARGFHRWSETFDRKIDDVLDVQSEIALAVAKSVMETISPAAAQHLADRPTDSADAYVHYLRGLSELGRPRQAETLSLAASHFERALARDNRFAAAYAGLCRTELGWYILKRTIEHFENAERHCHRALTLDAGIADVNLALGHLYRHSGQPEKAEAEFRQAIRLSPFLEDAHYGLARSYQSQGQLDRAEKSLRYSLELEPGHWGPFLALGNFLHEYGRYDEAIPYYLRVTELTPDNPDGYTNLGTAYFDGGDWEAARIAWSKSNALAPTPMSYRNLGTLHYYEGRFREATEMHLKAIALAPDDHWLWGKLAAASRYVEGGEQESREAYLKAIDLAEARLGLNPDDAETLAYLALYYVNAGETEKASDSAANALNREPGNPFIAYASAIVNLRLGNDARALKDIREAMKLGYSRRLVRADPQLQSLVERI